jgi:hypothetical protein
MLLPSQMWEPHSEVKFNNVSEGLYCFYLQGRATYHEKGGIIHLGNIGKFIHIFKRNQQDATLHNGIYCYKHHCVTLHLVGYT